MRRSIISAAATTVAALLLSGCLPRDPDPADTSLIDSVMAPAPEVVVQPHSDIIGRDSAFGPIGTIDSAGKVEPIRR